MDSIYISTHASHAMSILSPANHSTQNPPDLKWGIGRIITTGLVLLVLTGIASGDIKPTVSWTTGPLAANLSMADGETIPVSGSGMQASMLNGVVEPFQRYAEILLGGSIFDSPVSLNARVYDIDSGAVLADGEMERAAQGALLSIDMRAITVPLVRVRISAVNQAGKRAVTEALVRHSAKVPTPLPEAIQIHLNRPDGENARQAADVTFGVPFPAGSLWDKSGLYLSDQDGHPVPAQIETTALWAPSGSIRWLRVDAQAPAEGHLYLKFKGQPTLPKSALSVHTNDRGLTEVHHGSRVYIFGPGNSPLQGIMDAGQSRVYSADGRGLYLIDQMGNRAFACADDFALLVEAAGPQHASIRIEGAYRDADKNEFARYIMRFEFQAGSESVNVTHTLILTQDTRERWFSETGWELCVNTGTDPMAVFSLAPAGAPAEWERVDLPQDSAAFLFQREYLYFGQGVPKFEFGIEDANGRVDLLAEGSAMGDWFALQGTDGGLAMVCKDSARQHPKEFSIVNNRMNLLFFSPRGEDELDFRAATLVDKWQLEDWFPTPSREAYAKAHGRDVIEVIAEIDSNAVGWAKTHFLRLKLLQPDTAPEAIIQSAESLHAPVFAYVDPQWIYQSGALGPLWPEDSRRFGRAEAVIAGMLHGLYERVQGEFNGFVDYWAGPTYRIDPNRVARYRLSYGIRPALWLVYARSGDRIARDFAQSTNRAFLDNHLAHWSFEAKTRGLYNAAPGGPNNTSMSDLPFYWGQFTRSNISSSTNLDQFLLDYYLTGYRRAGDAVQQYGEGIKSIWQGEASMRSPAFTTQRPLATLGTLAQSYSLNWDPELRVILAEAVDFLYDPEGIMGVTKRFRAGGSAIYKTRADVRGTIAAANYAPGPRTEEIARRTAEFQWNTFLGSKPVLRYMQPLGVSANYLAGIFPPDPYISAADWYVRDIATHHDPETGETPLVGASAMASVFEALPYMMTLAARIPPAQASPTPWVDLNGMEQHGLLVVRKGRDDAVNIFVRSPTPDTIGRKSTGSRVTVSAIDNRGEGLEVTDITGSNSGFGSVARVSLTTAARAGDYLIIPAEPGPLFALADSSVAMVLIQPGFWEISATDPALQVFFQLTGDNQQARLYLEKNATIRDPDGEVFGEADGERGWISLPADQPGLWSFQMSGGRVSLEGAPPVFAFETPERYFKPDLNAIEAGLGQAVFGTERIEALGKSLSQMQNAAREMPESLDALRAITLENGSPYQRYLAYTFLADRLGDAERTALLNQAIGDLHWSIRQWAVVMLADTDAPNVQDIMLRAMIADPDPAVKAAASEGLLKGEAEALEPLLRLLQHRHWHVRAHAAVLLGQLGDTRAIPPLIEKLRHFDDWRVRNRAVDALRAITGMDFTGELARDPDRWVTWLDGED